MLILVFLMHTVLAAPKGKASKCQSHLVLTEDRGTDYYDRIAGAAWIWFAESPDPRRPRVLNANVIESAHDSDGAGVAIVEVLTAYARHRIPILVRVEHDRLQITAFEVVDRGLQTGKRTSDESQVAANAAMAKLLASRGSSFGDLNAEILISLGHSDQFFEVLVSAKVAGKRFEKIYEVFLAEGEAAQVEESGRHRYSKSVLESNFKRLLFEGPEDPTLKISSFQRQSLNSWRVVYTLGEVERVDEPAEKPARTRGRPLKQITIGPVGPQPGRAVLRGPGLIMRSHLLKVDDDHRFSLVNDPMR